MVHSESDQQKRGDREALGKSPASQLPVVSLAGLDAWAALAGGAAEVKNRPHDAESYIPRAVETWCAPMSYAQQHPVLGLLHLLRAHDDAHELVGLALDVV